jgi:large subunit ribosomal protein L32
MSVPKQHHTKTRRDRRRKRFVVKPAVTQKCPKCGNPVLPHQVCKKCGFYKGREVVNTLKKVEKKKSKK